MSFFWNSLLYTGYIGKPTQGGAAVTGRGPSPRIWFNPLSDEMSPDQVTAGFGTIDDFTSFPQVPYNSALTTGGWAAFTSNTAGTTILPRADITGGTIRFTTPASSGTNTSAAICGGANVGGFLTVDDTTLRTPMAFEARFQIGQNVAGGAKFAALMGIGDPGSAVTGTLADTTLVPLSTLNFIGFNLKFSSTAVAKLNFIYQANGQTLQAPITLNASPATSTWYKVGFRYDPMGRGGDRLYVYLDNQEVFKSTGARISASDLAAATFPTAVIMAPLVVLKSSEAAAKTLDLDWAAWYQAG